jgi:hypothetical protein
VWAEQNFQPRSQNGGKKATVGFVMSVRVPVKMEHLVSNWTGLLFNVIIGAFFFFRKPVEANQVSLKSVTRLTVTSREDSCTFIMI